MNRPARVAVLGAALGAVVVAGELLPAVAPDVTERPSVGAVPVTVSEVLCMGSPVVDADVDLLLGNVPVDGATSLPTTQEGDRPATAVLTGSSMDVLDITAAGEVARTRLEPVPSVSYTATAVGSLAPGLLAQTRTVGTGGTASGLASSTCGPVQAESWFVAGSGVVGRRSTLLVANPADSAAVIDVRVFDESGERIDARLREVGVPAGGTVSFDVDGLGAGAERLAVHVQATRVPVAAAMLVREVRGVDPGGISWVPASRAPAVRQITLPLPGDGSRTLRVVNPGEEAAVVAVAALTRSGTSSLSEEIVVEPAAVAELELDRRGSGGRRLAAVPAAFDVTSDVPVVVAVREDVVDGLPDLRVAPSAEPLAERGAALVAADARVELLVASVAEQDVRVRWRRFDEEGQRLDSGRLPVSAGSVAAVTLPRDRRDSSLLLDGPPDAVLAAIAETGRTDVPAVTGRDRRPATLADLTPLVTVRSEVDVAAVRHDLRAGLG